MVCRFLTPDKPERPAGASNISGANAPIAGNLSGGARNADLVHMTTTPAFQLNRHGITVNGIHPSTTRTAHTPSALAARAAPLGVSPKVPERQTGGRLRNRIRHCIPGLGQGLRGLRRACRHDRASRSTERRRPH
jgi:NAD(P)-dependent dehydrogenase (short-subunit alcohol dehydrogenase family)